MKNQIHGMMNKGLSVLRRFRECIYRRMFVKADINISCKAIGNEQMDSCMVQTDYFYRIPEMEQKKIVIYSAGIGDQINFELDLLKFLGETVRKLSRV